MKSIDVHIQKHLNNKHKGFYFWTCKKNFLSLYILTQYLNHHPMENPNNILRSLEYIFDHVLEYIRIHQDSRLKRKILHHWNQYRYTNYDSQIHISINLYNISNLFNLIIYIYILIKINIALKIFLSFF